MYVVFQFGGKAYATEIIEMDTTHDEEIEFEITSGGLSPFCQQFIPMKISYCF